MRLNTWAVPTLQDHRSNLVKLDFFSSIPIQVQEIVESYMGNISAPLLAENFLLNSGSVAKDFTIRHDGSIEQSFGITTNCHLTERIHQVGFCQISSIETSNTDIEGISQISTAEISASKFSSCQISTTQVSTAEIRTPEANIAQISTTQIGTTQINAFQSCSDKIGSAQINPTQNIFSGIVVFNIINPNEGVTQINSSKISFPISIPAVQLFNSNLVAHNLTPEYLSQFQSILPTYWNTLSKTNITFNITNLPTGQLAEGTITGYDSNGRPNSATISIDDDANGVGWFIDQTPGENSEFSTRLTNTAYQATTGAAVGKYDLLTAILHETGHTLGFINGYSEFDKNVKTGKFVTNTFSAQLTQDGSHLDDTLYPYDLLNTSLKPGIRKLPSQLDLAIINQLYSNVTSQNPSPQNPNAALTAGALFAIENGDFTNTAGWNLQGGTTISNGAATLTETSQKLAQLTQDLIIPIGAKRLQFTIKDNHLVLGDSSKTANDAFEVALLGTNYKPLAGTSQGLNNTDSLLNIQANGTTYKSNKVTITSLSPLRPAQGNATSQIVSIALTRTLRERLTDITPDTTATLYFNLLGFGAKESTVTIDDIKLFSAAQPIANPDSIVTNQNAPVAINPILNDSNVVGIQIIDRPTHGTLSQNPAGQIIYQPTGTYIGTDSYACAKGDQFTYIGFNSEGSISNQATVDIVVNNLPPSIVKINKPATISDGQNLEFRTIATLD
jgi:hypothetical protein